MDITLAGSGVPYQPSDDDLGGLSIELAAFDGEVGIGQVPMPDPSAAISVYDGRAIRIDEGATRLTDGFIVDQDRDRGPIPAGTAREHTFSAMDANALLDGFRITNRHRPSETDVARVLAFAALDGPDWDTTWVLDVDTVTMPAKVYDADGGWPAELIPDLVEVTGKTLWLHDLTDGSGRCLHYHNLQSGHGCGLSINDGKRYDAGLRSDPTVFEPWNPRRQRTSVDLRNDILGRDQKGRTSHATDATSISRHDADGLQHQSLQTFETTGQADLDVKTAAYLASSKDERDTYTLSIGPLDDAALALIRNGDIINTTSSVLGLSDSDQRIAHMVLKPWIGEQGTAVPDLWLADLELGAPVRRRSRRATKAIVDRVMHAPVVDTGAYTVGCYGPDTFGSLDGHDPSIPTPPQYGVGVLVGANSVTILTSTDTITIGTDEFVAVAGVAEGADPATPVLFADDDMGLVEVSFDVHVPTIAHGVPDDTFAGCFVNFKPVNDAGGTYSGADTLLFFANNGSLSVPPVPGDTLPTDDTYHVRFRTGLGIQQCKVWPTSQSEPVAFTTVGSSTIPHPVAGWYFVMHTNLVTQWTQTIEITNISFCVGASAVIAFHWTSFGPLPVKETPDGSTMTFTLPDYPAVAAGGYLSGTLHVFVDGIEQNKTETDPAAGTFTLSWAPTADMQVTASWVVP